MALNYRQEKAYTDRCKIYSYSTIKTNSIGGSLPTSTKHELKYKDVPCRFVPKISKEAADAFGHITQHMAEWRFSSDQELQEGWLVELDSDQHPMSGTVWHIMGIIGICEGCEGRNSHYKVVLAYRKIRGTK